MARLGNALLKKLAAQGGSFAECHDPEHDLEPGKIVPAATRVPTEVAVSRSASARKSSEVGASRISGGWIGNVRIPPAVVRYADIVTRRALDSTAYPALSRALHGYQGAALLYEALQLVPRDQFVEARAKARVLEDTPLPTGFGQSMAHPFVIARMIAVARVLPGMRILELEPGAGYASALLCAMGAQVFGVESIGLRAQSTRRLLDQLGFHRVLVATDLGAWIAERVGPFHAAISHKPLDEEQRPRVLKLLSHGARLVECGAEGAALGELQIFER